MTNFMKVVGSWFSLESETGEKYKALSVFRGLLKVFAWLFLVVAVLFSFIMLVTGPDAPTRLMGLLFLPIFFVNFIFIYTLADIILILVNIENNTQKAARMLGAKEEK